MQLLSHGDRIRCGTYRLHSAFRSAVNFVSDTNFVFVVNRNIGAGPLNIVLDETDFGVLRSLEVGTDGCWLDGIRIPWYATQQYTSELHLREFNRARFQSNLRIFEQFLHEDSPPKSLVFLIDNQRKEHFTSSFERECVRRFEAGWQKISSDDLPTGVRMIRGLGIGLTPSGDDFISGLLIALNVVQKTSPVDYSITINQMAKEALGSNLFTNSVLRCAANGWLSEKCQQLITSLVQLGEDEVTSATQRLLTMGDTSGADQGTGLLLGLKKFSE